jgi:hypothetical protein
MNIPEELAQTAAAQAAPTLTPEQQAQIEETARQLATSTSIPGVTTEMLDSAGQVVSSGLEGLTIVADVAAVVGTVVEAAVAVVSVVADVVGSIDLGGS